MGFPGIQCTPDTIRSINSATFTGAYQAVGSALTRQVRLIKFINNSTVAVTLSWDGVTDNDFIPANSFALYDVTSDKVKDDGWFIGVGTKFFVKGAAGVGSFFIVCLGA